MRIRAGAGLIRRWGRLGLPAAAAAILVVSVAAGRGAPETTAARSTDRPVQTNGHAQVTVTMRDDSFAPKKVVIDPGTAVKWINEGRNNHNVIPDNGRAFGDKRIKNGEAYEFRFEKPGTYGYYCSLHGAPRKQMYGTIVVKGPGLQAGGTNSSAPKSPGRPRTIRVPADARTIQRGVDRARPGDLVLVSPGVYREAVVVTTPGIVIRGVDRNRTTLDGEFQRENGVKVIGADAVAIENLGARRFTGNGFFWSGVHGYRGSYLTAVRNGDYGVYSFDSVGGQFDHSYAAGSPDAGFYIGQCFPCNAVVTDVVSENNGLGFSGTNAGGNLLIVHSTWRHNRAGIVPNSLDSEANPPQRQATIVGNVVSGNNNTKTPAIDAAQTALGNGIIVAGGNDNVVLHNLVYDHDLAGIVVLPNPDKTLWIANHNRVEENVVRDSRLADLGLFEGDGNCFAANTFRTSAPSNIQRVAPCRGAGIAATDQLDVSQYLSSKPPSIDYREAPTPEPPRQPNLPNAEHAKPNPATHAPENVDVERIRTPKGRKAS